MTVTSSLLWVTRSRPFNLLTAQRLRAMGLGVVLQPLFDIRPVRSRVDPPRKADIIAFTSVHGVKHHPIGHYDFSTPVFAVGETTAAAARRCGYRHVRSANGNLVDLQQMIVALVPANVALVHFSAAEPAGDLSAYLRARGYRAQQHVVYEAEPLPAESGLQILAAGRSVDGLLLYSPRAARRAADLIAEAGWRGRAYCLSEACANELTLIPGLDIKVAPAPNERALIATLRRANAPQQPIIGRLQRLIYGNCRREPVVLSSTMAANDNGCKIAAPNQLGRSPQSGPDDPPQPPAA